MYDDLADPASRIAATIKRTHGRSEQSVVHYSEPIDVSGVRSKLSPPQIVQDDAPLDGYGLYKALIAHIPHNTQASFTPEQIYAIRQAAEHLRWGRHSVDIRLSLPWPNKRFYMVFLAGNERRSQRRLEQAGQVHPMRYKFLGMAALIALISTTILLASHSALI